MKIISVVGARPNFIKIAPLLEEFKKYPKFKPILVHTGQHYDYEMSESFFKALNIPESDYNLEVGCGLHGWQTGKIMIEFEKVCLKEKPNLVIVVGDVNSTIATALVAAKLHIPIVHIEAGLRSRDMTMPEEINRILTDHISDFLFTTSKEDNRNLLKEGISKERIFLVGNIMTDTLKKMKIKYQESKILKKLNLRRRKYAVLTLHRPGNVDDKKKLKNLLEAFKIVSKKIPIIFPVHPRTKKQLAKLSITTHQLANLRFIDPLDYLDMINLVANSKLVFTDSGGLQHETTILGVPCLTLRKNAEWSITIKKGTNYLVGIKREKIIKETLRILSGKNKGGKIPRLWDGHAAKRIVKILYKQKYDKNC